MTALESFQGRRVLLTGADGSLGKVLAQKLCSAGAEVYGLGCRVSGKPQIDALVEDGPGRFDFLVLNDGTNHLSWIGTTPESDAEIMTRNVMNPYWVLNAVAARQAASAGASAPHPARVVFVASQTYRVPQRTTALYCASKAALVQMMRVGARELAPEGWVVNAVAPGKIEGTRMSEMTDAQVLALRGWSAEQAAGYARALVPAGRASSRDEIADVVLWALQAPAYVNGAVLEAMGGV